MMIGVVLGTIAIVLVTVVIGILVDRKVPRMPKLEAPEPEPKRIAPHGPGESPATAVAVRAGELDRLRTSQRCPSCGAVMRGEPDETVRYDGGDLLVLRFACRCGAKRSLYVRSA